jgi:hypothetical protein
MERNARDGWVTAVIVVTIIGALNWGLIGLFNWNLVDAILGGGSQEQTSGISRVIYALVGLAGLALAAALPRLKTGMRTGGPATAGGIGHT